MMMRKSLLMAGLLLTAVAAHAQSPAATATSAAGTQNAPKLPPLPDPFPAVMEQALPLSPDQIRQLRRRQDEVRRASAEPARQVPKPTIRHADVNLAPGGTPPIARVAASYGTAITFLDRTGAAWPIAAADVGSKEDFTVSIPVPGTNVVSVYALAEYANTNLIVFLKDMPTPIVVSLTSGQPAADYRLDLRIPYPGPNAMPDPTPTDVSIKFNRQLMDVLDGIPPTGAKPVTVNGQSGMAWRDGNKLLLRTTAAVMSPAPTQMTSAQDGTKAFELSYTPTVLVTQDGKLLTLRIGD